LRRLIYVEKLFYPESIMVVGVSDTPTNLGRNIIENLDRFHFKGQVYPVGREGGVLNGRKIYTRIEDVDASVDLAVFLIPARFIPEALEVCGGKGIRYAVIESGGFSEFADENGRLDELVLEIARKWHIRFVGPNCISIINLENGLVLPFVRMDPERMRTGPVSLVAQSGGIVNHTLRLCSGENLGFNKLISMGNKLDLDENDYLEFLTSDPETKTIGLYLESVSHGRRFMDLAGSTVKPVVVLKSNTGKASNQIARFHTAALAGDDEVVSSALRQAGIHRVHTLQEMINAFKIFNLPLMKGPNLAAISRSGGSAVMASDSAFRHGFHMATFSKAFLDHVRKGARAGVIRMTNPLDLGDVFDLEFYRDILERALQEKGVDGVLFSHSYLTGIDKTSTKHLIRAAREFSDLHQKPVALCMIPDSNEWFMMKRAADFPIFTEPEDALKALALSLAHYRNVVDRESHPRARFELPASKAQGSQTRSQGIQGPGEVLELLQHYDIPVADYRLARDREEALRAAGLIGYPVALKTADTNVVHKTEVGGVRLNIGTPEELKGAVQDIGGDRFLIQKMVDTGNEVFIGGKRDTEFGPVILFGMGGIFVEALHDVLIKVAPITEREAGEMIDGVRGSALLKGFRGGVKADLDALRGCLVRVSRLLYEHPEIQQLDINPLVVLGEGRGCLVVDARVVSSAYAGDHGLGRGAP
jgi:acyl-CoA synthetase (NDP forming)